MRHCQASLGCEHGQWPVHMFCQVGCQWLQLFFIPYSFAYIWPHRHDVCVYVCVCIYILYIYSVHQHIYIHIHIYIIHIYMLYIYIYIHTHLCVYFQVYVHVYIYICIHIYIYIYRERERERVNFYLTRHRISVSSPENVITFVVPGHFQLLAWRSQGKTQKGHLLGASAMFTTQSTGNGLYIYIYQQ